MFRDRIDAGKKLAEKLVGYSGKNTVVLSIPRGGVPVGYQIAKRLKCPHDIIIARKIGSPQNPEYGIGAINEIDGLVLKKDAIKSLEISEEVLKKLIAKEIAETERRRGIYRQKNMISLKNRIILLVDDGIATGVTIESAIKSLKSENPNEIVIATPVCSQEFAKKLKNKKITLVTLFIPKNLRAVGEYYDDFGQVEDSDVRNFLEKGKAG